MELLRARAWLVREDVECVDGAWILAAAGPTAKEGGGTSLRLAFIRVTRMEAAPAEEKKP
jgi:hypothetical protein